MRPEDDAFEDPCWGRGYGSRPLEELIEDVEWLSDLNYDQGYQPDDCIQLPDVRDGYEEMSACISPFVRSPDCVGAFNAFILAGGRNGEGGIEGEYARRFSSDSNFSNKRDAVRHLAISSLLMIITGRSTAEYWLYFHEYHSDSGGQRQDQQDRANNYYGMQMGSSFPRLPHDPSTAQLRTWAQTTLPDLKRRIFDFVRREPPGACLVNQAGDGFVDANRCGQNLDGWA